MCNSSLQIDNSTISFEDTIKWFNYCFCQRHFGTFVVTAFTAVYLFVGTPSHCYSLWLFLHAKVKPNLVFPLNVTLVDLLLCVLSCVSIITTYYFTIPSLLFGLFLMDLSWTVRPLIQICMCIEQYLAVIHPITFLRFKDIKYRIALAAVAWLIGLVNSLRLVFMKTNFFPDHAFFMFFLTAAIIISFCCASVLHALKRPGPGDRNNVETIKKNGHSKSDRGRDVEKRNAFKILSYILLSLLMCYLPQVVTYIAVIAEINKEMTMCNIFPLSLTVTLIILIISPLLRLYNEGHLKQITCLSILRGQMKDNQDN